MPESNNHFKYSKANILTSESVYNRAYFEKLIFILTGATAYLVGVLGSELIRLIIAKIVTPNDQLYPVVLAFIILFIILTAVNLFTYQKINSEREEILKAVNMSDES